MQHPRPALDAPAPTRTAVVAPVPAAEPLVAEHRQRLDAAAAWGVPAHVTVLYPFVEPAAVTEHLIAVLATALGSASAFTCSFRRTRFGGDVLWLEPEPDQPFRQLTTAVWGAFPQHPPYGGAYDDVIPHLTVAERRLAYLPAVQAAEHAVQSNYRCPRASSGSCSSPAPKPPALGALFTTYHSTLPVPERLANPATGSACGDQIRCRRWRTQLPYFVRLAGPRSR